MLKDIAFATPGRWRADVFHSLPVGPLLGRILSPGCMGHGPTGDRSVDRNNQRCHKRSTSHCAALRLVGRRKSGRVYSFTEQTQHLSGRSSGCAGQLNCVHFGIAVIAGKALTAHPSWLTSWHESILQVAGLRDDLLFHATISIK